MENKKLVKIVGICVIVAVVSFWGGLKYGQGKSAPTLANSSFSGQSGQLRGGTRGGTSGGFVSGSVISVDSKSLTVQLRNNPNSGNGGATTTQGTGSKIVFFSPSMTVEKTVSGSASDVAVGNQVTIVGSANSDGSVNANSIQIRPASPTQNKTN